VWEGILLSSKRIRALVSGQWGGLERGKDEERGGGRGRGERKKGEWRVVVGSVHGMLSGYCG
jgi:hypothetical protein